MGVRLPSSRAKTMMWFGLASWALLLIIVNLNVRTPSTWLTGSPAPFLDIRPLLTVEGEERGLLAGDSTIAILVLTAECPICQLDAPSYHHIEESIRSSNAAFRVLIASNGAAARQLGALMSVRSPVLVDSMATHASALGVSKIPSFYVFGSGGNLIHSYSPFILTDSSLTEISHSIVSISR